MRFDTTFEMIRMEETSDLMGGFEIIEASIGEISAFTSPVTAEIMLKEHGVVSNRAMKIFTKDYLPDDHVHLREVNSLDGEFTDYEILQVADYKKYRMLLVQVI